MPPYVPSLPDLRAAVDASLEVFLRERRAALPDAAPMLDEIERLISSGGKRLRPSFCYWGFRAAGGAHGAEAIRAAASLELLHTFAIVHDDIMDDSSERRGEPAVHVRHGTGIALLVGDLALVLADELFVESGFSPSVLLRAWRPYSTMRQEVIAGQQLDVLAARRALDAGSAAAEPAEPAVDAAALEAEARRIAVMKSGRYSIEKPLLIGATLASASRHVIEGLSRLGEPLGEAFQLRDDLLGMYGDPAITGKPADGDIREGKRHVLFAKALGLVAADDRAFLRSHWGGGARLEADQVERLRDIVSSSGARRAVEELLDERAADARKALADLEFPSDVAAALEDLVRHATHRRL